MIDKTGNVFEKMANLSRALDNASEYYKYKYESNEEEKLERKTPELAPVLPSAALKNNAAKTRTMK